MDLVPLTTNYPKVFIKFAFIWFWNVPANKYMFKVNKKNDSKRWRICLKLTIKTRKQHQRGLCGVFIYNSEHISHVFLAYVLLNLSRSLFAWLFYNTSLEVKPCFAQNVIMVVVSQIFKVMQLVSKFFERYHFCWYFLKRLLEKLY